MKEGLIYYQLKIDWDNKNYNTCKAVYMALWLIIENDKTLNDAVRISRLKKDAKKSPVIKMIREILPAGYLSKKAASRMSEGLKNSIRQASIEKHNTRKFEKVRL